MLCFNNFTGESVSAIKKKLGIFEVKLTLMATRGQTCHHSGKNIWAYRKRFSGFAASFMVLDSKLSGHPCFSQCRDYNVA